MEKKRIVQHFPLIILGLTGGIMFIYLGYLVSATMQPYEEDLNFFQKVFVAQGRDFSTNYNQYTPIVMVLAFVIYEFIIFLLFVFSHKKVVEKKTVVNMIKRDGDDEENNEVVNESIFRELYANSFTLEQIKEMMRLSNYMQDADVNIYLKMFDKSMTPEQINQYINIFYG